jgi:18S rRNA (guanine1575-N7)-methyltransferase
MPFVSRAREELGCLETCAGACRRKKQRQGNKKNRTGVKSKDWIQGKKERAKKQGQDVRPDSKYTARKRKTKF